MPEERRCYVCGREGTRQFRWMPEKIAEPWGVVVGGFYECANKDACRRRCWEQSRRAGYHPEGGYP